MMSWSIRARVALACSLAAVACGGGGDGAPDAAPTVLTCDTAGGVGGDELGLRIGLREGETGFEELHDGDQCPLVVGAQGLLMMLLDARGTFSIPEDSVCLDCVVEVSPVGEYPGISQDGVVVFRRVGETDEYTGFSTVILGSSVMFSDDLDGASVTVTMDCIGHGFSETLVRSLDYYLLE